MTLSNGLQVEEIERDGYKEIVCAGNPDRVLTQAEWDEAARRISQANAEKIESERLAKHAASKAAYQD